ncbi:MAG: hypothetical protein D6695_04630 [Planctomycetota bacterium]|nr:MAG: hypothetical protein D6695_04630 [Planctomycetota bacterium]
MSVAGLAVAQPTVDGVYDPGTEGSFYSDVLWSQNQPTAFGDNQAGDFTGGDFGDPPGDVMTGVELCIPLAAIGGPLHGSGGTSTFQLAGWVNSGDRTFMSNQIIHDGNLPIDTPNIGNAPDFTAMGGISHTSITANVGTIVVDGMLDAAYGPAQFLQTNYTGFGNETDGTVDGGGPNGGGSEIDAVYAATDGVNLYLFIAGNLEYNGNGLDLYIDSDASDATGLTTLSSGAGAGGFIISGQAGLVFDAGFGADFVVSADSWNDDGDDGTTPNVPRLYAGPATGNIDEIGSLPGYGAANAGAVGSGYSMGIDNSNTLGVIGSPSLSSPVAPDANWAYGSELCNVRSYVDTANGKLYIFIGGNLEVNYNKLNLFLDTAPGGQNTLRADNVDISFNGLNRMADCIFDAGFEPDFWLNTNNGVDGGSGNLQNYTDCAVLRTNGPIVDPFFGLRADYGSFFGGFVTDGQGNPVAEPVEVMDFSGDRFDQQDGFLANLYSNYAPRASADLGLDILNGSADPSDRPAVGLVQVAINNSNVDGVTAFDAASPSVADAPNVNTGIELCLDLNEIGWDGSQDILLAGWISSGGFDFVSNQVIGGLPTVDNLGEVSAIDFGAIAGDQFINLMSTGSGCRADTTGDGILDFFDVLTYLGWFSGGDMRADFVTDGILDFFDVLTFLGEFDTGCP